MVWNPRESGGCVSCYLRTRARVPHAVESSSRLLGIYVASFRVMTHMTVVSYNNFVTVVCIINDKSFVVKFAIQTIFLVFDS